MEESILLRDVNSAINKIISPVCSKQSTERGIKEPEKLLSIMENILDVIPDAESRKTEEGVRVWLQNLERVVSVLNDLLDEVPTADRGEENIHEIIQKVCIFLSSICCITSTSLNRKISDVRANLDDMTAEIEKFGFVKKVYDDAGGVRKPSENLLGRDSDKGNIIRQLLKYERNDHALPVFAIVGAVGLGKTTLAKSVFDDDAIKGHFGVRLWANVSFERFNLQKFVARILGVKDTDESLDRLQKELRQKLNGKRFLLVLDGIQSMNLLQLDDLQELLINDREGNKILATTRSDEIACRMDDMIELGPLSDDEHSWKIFAESAGFLKEKQEKHPNLVQMGKELAGKCNGVPLALKILGGILNRSTDETTWMRVKGNEKWQGGDFDIKNFLELSFDELSQRLKAFFAYCAVVWLTSNPPDKERIMQMWTAQADVRPSSHKKLEDVANEYFDELSSRFFFKDVEEDDLCQVTRFELHDRISIPDDMRRLISSVHSNTKLSNMEYVYCKTDLISESSPRRKFSKSLHNSEKLGTFLFLREQETSHKLFSTFKRLRVMDLCLSQFEELPSSISNLKRLRYLDLSRNEKITHIPSSIGDLEDLETLRTDGCKKLTELPSQVWELKKLRNLYASSLQTALPENIPSSPLQTLRLDSFKGLKELSKAMSWGHLETLGILYCPKLCLPKDNTMSKYLRNVTIVGLPKLTEIPPWLKDSAGSLESLYIAECQYLKTLPDWIDKLTKLKRLTIRDCFGFTSLTDSKARLPDGLELLRIHRCPGLTRRCERERGADCLAIARVKEIYVDYYCSILKPATSSDLPSSSGPGKKPSYKNKSSSDVPMESAVEDPVAPISERGDENSENEKNIQSVSIDHQTREIRTSTKDEKNIQSAPIDKTTEITTSIKECGDEKENIQSVNVDQTTEITTSINGPLEVVGIKESDQGEEMIESTSDAGLGTSNIPSSSSGPLEVAGVMESDQDEEMIEYISDEGSESSNISSPRSGPNEEGEMRIQSIPDPKSPALPFSSKERGDEISEDKKSIQAVPIGQTRKITTLCKDQDMLNLIRIFVDGIGEDVEKLNNIYESVKAVLSDAENRMMAEEVARVWVERMRAVSYEVENALDVWSTVLLKVKISGAENKRGSKSDRLSDCSWLNQLAQEGDFPRRIRELNERLGDINKEKDAYKFKSEPMASALPLPQHKKSTSFIKTFTVCGRDMEIQRLVGNLCNPSQGKSGLEVISIVGMGGVGKTTLAQCVYNDATVRSHFQKMIWVRVSNPFDELQVVKSISRSLGGIPSDFTDLQDDVAVLPITQDILEFVNSSITGKRYLLVLDDVWTYCRSDWKSLLNSLDSGADGSKILVTTRNVKCLKAIGSTSVHPLRELSPEESWKLFSQIAFFDKNKEDIEDLKEIGQKIVGKCKGLPLALKAIASHLLFKSSIEREWQKVLESEIWKLEIAENGIFKPLLLSYYDFPLPIKKCFLLCAVFPKDYRFKVEELKRLWMSQGYLNTSRNEDMETIGEEYFEHLLARSFFRDLEYRDKYTGAVKYCKMHDIVHDFAQFLSKDESLIIDIMENKRSDLSFSSCRNLRHLTVLNANSGEDVMSSSYSTSIQQRLHDLHTLRIPRSYSIREIGMNFLNLCQHLCFIKALDLSDNGIVEIPEAIGGFVHLRYLDLSRNSKLEMLPGTIYELCNLQTFLLDYCWNLEELPEGIEKLINLRHLEIDEATVLPKGIGNLPSLRTLNRFNVGRNIEGHGGEVAVGATIGDLRNLNNLQSELRITHLGNVKDGREARKAELRNKRGLTWLMLYFGKGEGNGGDEKEVIEALEPNHGLEILGIGFYSGKMLPSWISMLTKLRRLDLYRWEECEELPPLGQLPSLESLRIEGMWSCKRVGEEFLGIRGGQTSTRGGRDGKKGMTSSVVAVAFPKLKELTFHDMIVWAEWEDAFISGGNDTYEDDLNNFKLFPCLERLVIMFCPQLRSLPRFISKSPIQALEILYCPILQEGGSVLSHPSRAVPP